MDAARIYGKGFRFPFGLDPATGRVAWSEGEDNVSECIQHILLTELGERRQAPDFGAGLGAFLYEPSSLTTRTRIADRVRAALKRDERRIRVRSVEVTPDSADPAVVVIQLSYELVATAVAATMQLGVRLQG